jgi:hypothetical protein
MRESRFVRIAKLAYHIAQQTLPTYAHPKSRHDYTFPQRVACVMLKIYLNYTYRDLEEWLLATDQVRQALQLSRVPDHTTLYRTFAKLSQQQWQQLNDALLQHLSVQEMTVAVDTTGFRNDTASAYYQSRRGNTRRAWHKGGFVVGTESLLIVGMRVGRGPGSDAKWLAPLRAQARRYVVRKGRSARFWLLADAGFDGRDVEWTDVVPPIRRGGRLRAWSRVLRAELVERAKASGLYGQRWKVETVISVIKRKFGDGVRSRGLRLARREVLAKGVVYNLHRSFFCGCARLVCVVGFEERVSVVRLGIIATEHLEPLIVSWQPLTYAYHLSSPLELSTRFARKKFLKSLVRLQYDAEISYSQEGIPWWLQAIAGVGLTGAAF